VWHVFARHTCFLSASQDKKIKKSVVNVLCSSKIGCIFAADFAAHVLLAMMLMR
jgi:hypothetical protein